PRATTSRTSPATASSTAAGPACAGVATERTGPIAPAASTRAAAVLVPPRSTPTTTSLTLVLSAPMGLTGLTAEPLPAKLTHNPSLTAATAIVVLRKTRLAVAHRSRRTRWHADGG